MIALTNPIKRSAGRDFTMKNSNKTIQELIQVREKFCNNCAYVKGSKSHLTVTLKAMVDIKYLHPCPAELAPISGSINSGVEQLVDHCEKEQEPFKICRGLVLALLKYVPAEHRQYANSLIEGLSEEVKTASGASIKSLSDLMTLERPDNG